MPGIVQLSISGRESKGIWHCALLYYTTCSAPICPWVEIRWLPRGSKWAQTEVDTIVRAQTWRLLIGRIAKIQNPPRCVCCAYSGDWWTEVNWSIPNTSLIVCRRKDHDNKAVSEHKCIFDEPSKAGERRISAGLQAQSVRAKEERENANRFMVRRAHVIWIGMHLGSARYAPFMSSPEMQGNIYLDYHQSPNLTAERNDSI
jgi:hypothetical protein